MAFSRSTTACHSTQFGVPALAVLAASLLCLATAHAQGAAGGDTRYIHATQLNLRAEANPSSATLSRLRINDTVLLKKKEADRWCLVETTDGSKKSGYVDCTYLGTQALSLEKIELDFATQALALHRLSKSFDGRSSNLDSLALEKHKDALRFIEPMFALIERHFSLSPSLYLYQDYGDLIKYLEHFADNQDPKATQSPLPAFGRAKLPQLETMERALSRDYAAQPATAVPSGIATTLGALIAERGIALTNPEWARNGKREQKRARVRQRASRNALDLPATASFFQNGKWAVGWAGGPLVNRRRVADPEGVVYDIRFDGANVTALADVYEMAKEQRLAVKVQFKPLAGGELSQMTQGPDGTYRGATLQLRMPVWAITASGLVKGYVRQVSFGGDVCSGSDDLKTAAEIVFAKPVRETIQAVFTTNAAVNPVVAKVQIRKRAFLEGGGDTMTGRVDVTVDLDGDGVADLRTVVSQDSEVSSLSTARPMLARFDKRQPSIKPYLRRIGGWYANDVFSLEANMGDAWRVLSFYNVVTCT